MAAASHDRDEVDPERRHDELAGRDVPEAVSPAEERFERSRKIAGVILTPIAFFLTYFLLRDSTLSPEGRTLSAILAAVGVMWVSEVIPLPVTALLGAVLCAVLGAAPVKTVLAFFADPIVFVFLGGFMLARAMTVHSLDRRIALSFLAIPWIGGHPARMLGGLGLVTAILSMWVSNTATTAMMLPIGLGILSALHQTRLSAGLASGPMDARTWPFATGMMLMVAYAASIGGIGTPVGSPPNLIGIGLIRQATGVEISFFRWMALAVPMFLVMGAALFTLLYLLHPARSETIKAAFDRTGDNGSSQMRSYIHGERAKLGSWSWGQINTLIVFILAVTFWILPGVLSLPFWSEGAAAFGKSLNTRLPESIVAVSAAVLLFMLPVDLPRGRFTLHWEDAVKIDWGTILLFGGGLALGSLMFSTGVATAMGQHLTGYLGADSSVWVLTAVSIALAILLSEATSNTAAANMIIPVVIGICQSADISPLPPALGACLGASFGFMLPVSTPPNAIVYGSGLIRLPSMMRAGILFDVLGFVIIWVGLRLLCPILGLV